MVYRDLISRVESVSRIYLQHALQWRLGISGGIFLRMQNRWPHSLAFLLCCGSVFDEVSLPLADLVSDLFTKSMKGLAHGDCSLSSAIRCNRLMLDQQSATAPLSAFYGGCVHSTRLSKGPTRGGYPLRSTESSVGIA